MKEIYVNHIEQTIEGATFGISTNLENSCSNLELIYGEELGEIFKIETEKNGIFRQFDKYYQYIFSAETSIIPRFNITMVFIDCHNDVDLALEIYSTKGSNLYEAEKTRIMDLFNEIRDNTPDEYASLKVIESNDI